MIKSLLILLLLTNLLLGEEEKETGLTLTLISENQAIVPGNPFTVGIHIQHEPEYHTYWKSPGIVGMATQLEWHLPDGWTASPTHWPYPQLCDMAGHPCHGYKRDVTLLTTLTPPAEIADADKTLKVSAAWMCCAKGCYPGRKDLSLTLPVAATSESDPTASALIEKAKKEIPQASENWTVQFRTESDDSRLILTFKGPSEEEPQYFFSSDNQISSNQKQTFRETAPGTWELSIARAEFSPTDQTTVPGILKTSLDYYQVAALPK